MLFDMGCGGTESFCVCGVGVWRNMGFLCPWCGVWGRRRGVGEQEVSVLLMWGCRRTGVSVFLVWGCGGVGVQESSVFLMWGCGGTGVSVRGFLGRNAENFSVEICQNETVPKCPFSYYLRTSLP